MLSSVNYQKMKKKEIIDRCKKLEELLGVRNNNIAKELLEQPSDTKTQYGIDYYFNTERDEDEVCVNVNFKK